MSGQDKRQDIYEYGHVATSAPEQPTHYQNYTPPQFTLQTPQPQMAASYVPAGQQPQFGYGYQNFGYQTQPIQYIEPPPRPRPEVTAYHPNHGVTGTKVVIYLRSVLDLAGFHPSFGYTVHFKDKRIPATLTRMESHTPVFQYAVTTTVPRYEGDQWLETIPMYLNISDAHEQNVNFIFVGEFIYDIPQGSTRHSPIQGTSRKRKTPVEDSNAYPVPAKRPSLQQLHDSREGHRESFGSSEQFASPTQAGHQQPFVVSYSQANISSHEYPYSAQSARPQPKAKPSAPTPQSSRPKVGPQRSAGSPSMRHSRSPTAPGGRHSRSPSSSTSRAQQAQPGIGSGTPALIRTSTLHSQPAASPNDATPSQVFNPYSIYPNKAVLKIQGDLDEMADNWTPEEWQANRRLVEFRREQEDNTITTSFQAVTLESRAPKSICVSCIWWEEKKEAFVTSVDTIYLLESLVAVRFTVEEKNRIRRNLEGFKPLTVSKGKADSEEFFKVIMGFPNPKPRNIEKDVKVFPWKILSLALKKIIGKYSASYASTAGTLLPQGSTETSSAAANSPPSSTSSSPASATLTRTFPSTQPSQLPTSGFLGTPHEGLRMAKPPTTYLTHMGHEHHPHHGYAQWGQPQPQPQASGITPYHMPTAWEEFGVLPNTASTTQPGVVATPSQGFGYPQFAGQQSVDPSRLPPDPKYRHYGHPTTSS